MSAVISATDRALLDCEELRELAKWLDGLGKKRNSAFLSEVATRYEVISGAYSTAARKVLKHAELIEAAKAAESALRHAGSTLHADRLQATLAGVAA